MNSIYLLKFPSLSAHVPNFKSNLNEFSATLNWVRKTYLTGGYGIRRSSYIRRVSTGSCRQRAHIIIINYLHVRWHFKTANGARKQKSCQERAIKKIYGVALRSHRYVRPYTDPQTIIAVVYDVRTSYVHGCMQRQTENDI